MCSHPAQYDNHLVTASTHSIDGTYLGTCKIEARDICHMEAATTLHTADLEGLRDVAETLVQLALCSLHLLQLQPAHRKHALQEGELSFCWLLSPSGVTTLQSLQSYTTTSSLQCRSLLNIFLAPR